MTDAIFNIGNSYSIKRCFILLLLLMIFWTPSYASHLLDSLRAELNAPIQEDVRVDILNRLAEILVTTDKDQALVYAEDALQKSFQLKYKKGTAEAYYQLATIERKANQYEKARVLYERARGVFEEIKDMDGATLSMRKIGYMYSKEGEYSKALEYYFAATKISEESNLKPKTAKLKSAIAGVYRLKGDYDKALKYAFDALRIQEEIKDEKAMTFTLDRIGVIYRLQMEYDEALSYYVKALDIRERLKGISKSDLAYSNMIIGDIYLQKENFEKAKNYHTRSLEIYTAAEDKEGIGYAYANLGKIENQNLNNKEALNYYKKACEIFEDINHKRGSLSTLHNITELYQKRNDNKNAELNALELLSLAKDLGSKSHIVNAYEMLYNIKNDQKLYKEALFYYENFISDRDSLWNHEKSKEIAMIESQFHNEAQERENELLKFKNAENQAVISKQKMMGVMLMIGLILLAAIASLLFKRYQTKQQANDELYQKNQEISQKKEALQIAQKKLNVVNESLERKVSQRTAALKASNEELEKFAYLASHDLKHPLRNITGFSQLLQRDLKKKGVLDNNNEEYLDMIINGTKYMNNLIEDILEFSRFTMSNDNYFESISFCRIVEEAKNNLNLSIKESGATIICMNLPKQIVVIKIKMIQLVQNLISNAIKFRNKDQPLKITIMIEERSDEWLFSVSDNGIGIEKEYHELIFQLFKQIHNKQMYGGSGMGLAICHKISEQHKGKIWVESELGKGSTFYVTINKELAKEIKQTNIQKQLEKEMV